MRDWSLIVINREDMIGVSMVSNNWYIMYSWTLLFVPSKLALLHHFFGNSISAVRLIKGRLLTAVPLGKPLILQTSQRRRRKGPLERTRSARRTTAQFRSCSLISSEHDVSSHFICYQFCSSPFHCCVSIGELRRDHEIIQKYISSEGR